MLDKINVLVLVLFLSFFYVPYDSFNIGIGYSFWNVPILFYILNSISILVLLVVKRCVDKTVFWVCSAIFFFLALYMATLFISGNFDSLPLVFSIITGCVFLGYSLLVLNPHSKEKLEFFLKCTFFYYSLCFCIFVFIYGIEQYRFVAGGISNLNPAFLGFVSGFIFLLCVYVAKSKLINVSLCLTFFCGSCALFTVVLTQTRIALIGILLSLFILMANRFFYVIYNKKISLKSLVVIFFVMLSSLCFWYFSGDYWAQLNLNRIESLLNFITLKNNTTGPSPDAGRIDIWLTGLNSMDSYFWGHGLGSFITDHGIAPHNTFLLVFYEMGMLGLFLFFLGILCFLFYALKYKTTFLFIYLMVYGLGNDFIYMPQFYFLFSLFFCDFFSRW